MYNIRKDIEAETKSFSDVAKKGRRVRDISDVRVSGSESVMSGGEKAFTECLI